jgi:dTDP-4-amino-4,6-dideoxygalactose transaminase
VIDLKSSQRDLHQPVKQLKGPMTSAEGSAPEPLRLIAPTPPKLSEHSAELAEIEEAGIYSNYGPVNTRFEHELIETVFQTGKCLTVCNATLGLMLAIREVMGEDLPAERRYALMPSFTFAAGAQAALWCGLTPLLCDIDPETWLPSEESEEALLEQYRDQIAVIVPYATFGNILDLARYDALSEKYGVPIVVDAAASLGSLDAKGIAFGSGFRWPVIFSMHATKVFAVGEGGVIYCADPDRIARLRAMGSFGFGQERSAMSIGLNSKLSEVAALTASLQLRNFSTAVLHSPMLRERYRQELEGDFDLQRSLGRRQVCAFQSVLLPNELVSKRSKVAEMLKAMNRGPSTTRCRGVASGDGATARGMQCE